MFIENGLTIFWHREDENAIIPTKRDEDAGFDIYTIEDEVLLKPGQKYSFDTGLAVALNRSDYWLMVFDRGSTGSIGLHVHCGVIDNGYRGRIFICLCNDNSYSILVTNKIDKAGMGTKNGQDVFLYPAKKAIAQIIPVQMPKVSSLEIVDTLWNETFKNNSVRGTGKLGDSGK